MCQDANVKAGAQARFSTFAVTSLSVAPFRFHSPYSVIYFYLFLRIHCHHVPLLPQKQANYLEINRLSENMASK